VNSYKKYFKYLYWKNIRSKNDTIFFVF
jgi:hypothetical protein